MYPFSRLLWRGVVWAGTSGCWPSGAHGQSGSYASSDGGSAPRGKRGYDPNSGPPFHTLARLDEKMRQNWLTATELNDLSLERRTVSTPPNRHIRVLHIMNFLSMA